MQGNVVENPHNSWKNYMAMIASFVCDAITAQKIIAINRIPELFMVGPTCSENKWQRVAGSQRRREPPNSTFYVSMPKLQYGDRPVSNNISY